MTKSTNKPDFDRLLQFQKLILNFQDIDRRIHVKKNGVPRPENDVEHSYSLAIVGWYLAQFFPELDKDKVIRIALVHDLVEVHAGDTYIFSSEEELNSKKDREAAAAERLRKEWSDFPDMNDTIEFYESKSSPEAMFVYALDKILPMMLNIISDGYTWQHENLNLPKIHNNKKDKVSFSPEIEDYYNQIYAFLLDNQHLFIKPEDRH